MLSVSNEDCSLLPDRPRWMQRPFEPVWPRIVKSVPVLNHQGRWSTVEQERMAGGEEESLRGGIFTKEYSKAEVRQTVEKGIETVEQFRRQ
jgi:hypothetical protein